MKTSYEELSERYEILRALLIASNFELSAARKDARMARSLLNEKAAASANARNIVKSYLKQVSPFSHPNECKMFGSVSDMLAAHPKFVSDSVLLDFASELRGEGLTTRRPDSTQLSRGST